MTSSGIPKALEVRGRTKANVDEALAATPRPDRVRVGRGEESPHDAPRALLRRRADHETAKDEMASALPALRGAATECGEAWRVGTVVHRGEQPGWPIDRTQESVYPHLSSAPEHSLSLGFSVGDKVTTPLGRQATIVGTNAEPTARSYTDVHGRRRTHLWAEYLKASEPEASTSSGRLLPESESSPRVPSRAADDEAPSPSRWSQEELDALQGSFPLRSHRSLRAMVRLGMPSRGGFFLPGREQLGEPKGADLTSLPYLRLLFTRSFEDMTQHDNFRTAEWLRGLPRGSVVWSPTGVQMRIHDGEPGHTRGGRLDAKRVWASQVSGRLASTLTPLEEPVIIPGQPHAASIKKACKFAAVKEGRLLKDRITPMQMRPNVATDRFRDDRSTPAAIATRCGFGMSARGTTANELERVVRPRLERIRERLKRHEVNEARRHHRRARPPQ